MKLMLQKDRTLDLGITAILVAYAIFGALVGHVSLAASAFVSTTAAPDFRKK
ncbi:MAG: hypothetical protein ACXQT4_07430 [Methanotrichaceae archaeon]